MFSLNRFGSAALVISLSLSSFLAKAGPGGTGGGDVPLSSPEQVEAAIFGVKPKITEWLRVQQIRYNSYSDVSAISKLYKDFYLAKSGVDKPMAIWSIEKSEFIIKKDSPCLDFHDNEKDAAVQGNIKPGTPICISVQRLVRVPPDQLERHIVALVAHELTHQILQSLDETWPTKIQLQVPATLSRDLGEEVVCKVHTFRGSQGEVTGYQIRTAELKDCSDACVTGFSFAKDQLSNFLEIARKKKIDPIGRSVGCTSFKFEN